MIEFGRAIMVQQILTNASREGARRAVLDGSTTTDVNSFLTDATNGYLPKSGITGATVTISNSAGVQVEPSTITYGQPVTVKVQVAFSKVSWLPSPLFFKASTLQATTVMRRETVQ
jgi:Flp pilus assembly protein TadG